MVWAAAALMKAAVGAAVAQHRRRRLQPARQGRREPVDDGALGGVHGVFGQVRIGQPGCVIGKSPDNHKNSPKVIFVLGLGY